MKIFEAKNNLSEAIKILNNIKTNPTNSTDEQKQLTLLLSLFTPTVVDDLKKKLEKTKKRREKAGKQRKEKQKIQKELVLNRKRKNEEVERLFRQHQEAVARSKTEESVRRQADEVLRQVTRRKLEGRRVLSLLTALAKLRIGRCQQDVAQGATPSASVTDTFDTTLGKLGGLWEKQMEDYATEEAGLKVMLAEGSASRLGQSERALDAILHDWQSAMFGSSELKREPTWQQLIHARQQWDRYVVSPDTPLSSPMPVGWVLPQKLNEEWMKHVTQF